MEPARGHGNNTCLHTPPTHSDPHGRVRLRNEYNIEQIKRVQKDARNKSTWSSDKVGYAEKDPRLVVLPVVDVSNLSPYLHHLQAYL